MDAREIESLSMIARGFEDLRDVNPELAYNVILDILSGINECVFASCRDPPPPSFPLLSFSSSSSAPEISRVLTIPPPPIIQEPTSSTVRANCAWAIPAQAHHSQERDDVQRAHRHRGRGDLWTSLDVRANSSVNASGGGNTSTHSTWRRAACAEVADRGTPVYALVRGPEAPVEIGRAHV